MKKVIVYSTGCPKCNVLMDKLNEKKIIFSVVNDVEKMVNLGIDPVPVLSVDGKLFDFSEAVKWINKEEFNGNANQNE